MPRKSKLHEELKDDLDAHNLDLITMKATLSSHKLTVAMQEARISLLEKYLKDDDDE